MIDNFTGVSDPYEEPTDAELTIDTSAMSRQQSVDAVLRLLTTGGWLPSDEPAPDAHRPGLGARYATRIGVGPAPGAGQCRQDPGCVHRHRHSILSWIQPQALWSSSAWRPRRSVRASCGTVHQRPGHRVALTREQHVTGRPAHQQGQPEQQQAAAPAR